MNAYLDVSNGLQMVSICMFWLNDRNAPCHRFNFQSISVPEVCFHSTAAIVLTSYLGGDHKFN
jgi:hypothetical protein